MNFKILLKVKTFVWSILILNADLDIQCGHLKLEEK